MTEIKSKTPQSKKRQQTPKGPQSAPPQKKGKLGGDGDALSTPKSGATPGKGKPFGNKFQNTPAKSVNKAEQKAATPKSVQKEKSGTDTPKQPVKQQNKDTQGKSNKKGENQGSGDGQKGQKRKGAPGGDKGKTAPNKSTKRVVGNLSELQKMALGAQKKADAAIQAQDNCRLFIRNFPKTTTDAELKSLSKDVLSVRRQKGFAFLTFASEKLADKNYKALQGKQMGDVTVVVDYLGAKSSKKKQNLVLKMEDMDPFKLFVTGFATDITIDHLHETFPGSVEIWLKVWNRKGNAVDKSKKGAAQHAKVFFDSAQLAKGHVGVPSSTMIVTYGKIFKDKAGQLISKEGELALLEKRKASYVVRKFGADKKKTPVAEDEEEDDDEEEEETSEVVPSKKQKTVAVDDEEEEDEDEEEDDEDDEEEDDEEDDDSDDDE